MPAGREFRLCKPISRELVYAIRHVLSAENAKCQHLSGRKFGFEIRVKILPDWFDNPIAIPALHLVADQDLSHVHRRRMAKLLRDGRQHYLTDDAGRGDALVTRVIVTGHYDHHQIQPRENI